MKKEILRETLFEKRRSLSLDLKKQFDQLIYDELITSDSYKSSKGIFIYVSTRDEVDTIKLINKFFKDHKKVYVPKVISKELGMKAVKIESLKELTLSSFGILEPKEDTLEDTDSSFDLIIAPGICFDESGNRIGYGGGFYDRFLDSLDYEVRVIALAYSMQILKCIPVENHDKKMDGIITEKRNIIINSL